MSKLDHLVESVVPDNTDAFKNILTLVIRKILPDMIAQDIVDVQPMTGPDELTKGIDEMFGDKIKPGSPDTELEDYLRSNNKAQFKE